MTRGQRRAALAAAGLCAAISGIVWSWGRLRPHPTPALTEADLRAFVRQSDAAFRTEIARQESGQSRTPLAALRAIAPEDGVALSAPPPPGSRLTPHGTHTGQFFRDGYYLAPPTTRGRTIDHLSYSGPDGARGLQLVLAGAKGIGAQKVPLYESPVLLDGDSLLRDEGPMTKRGGAYRLPDDGPERPGLGIVQRGGPAPHQISLAPDELPSARPAEPQGYALAFDQAIVWRDLRPYVVLSTNATYGVQLPVPLPPSLWQWLSRSRHLEVREESYRVRRLAHVYTRSTGGRCRYARSYTFDGLGSAFFSDDENRTRGLLNGSGPPIVRYGEIVFDTVWAWELAR